MRYAVRGETGNEETSLALFAGQAENKAEAIIET